MDPVNVQAKFKVRIALPVPGIIAGMAKLEALPGYAVQGHPRSLILVQIGSTYMTSYQSVIVTLVLSHST